MTDDLSLDEITQRRENDRHQFLTFPGSENTFNLSGVTIIFDTRLREKLDPPIHTPEFVLSGDNNVVRGLSIINKGNGSSDAGNVLAVTRNRNTVKDIRLLVRGSYPYGYGDLLGFGGKPHQQLLEEEGNRLIDVEKHGWGDD